MIQAIRKYRRMNEADKKGWGMLGRMLQSKGDIHKARFYNRQADRYYKLARNPKERKKLLGA